MFHKISRNEKFYGKDKWEGRQGKTRFPVKSFCLTVLKFFVGEPFRLSLTSGIEKRNA